MHVARPGQDLEHQQPVQPVAPLLREGDSEEIGRVLLVGRCVTEVDALRDLMASLRKGTESDRRQGKLAVRQSQSSTRVDVGMAKDSAIVHMVTRSVAGVNAACEKLGELQAKVDKIRSVVRLQ
jgi:hypothetical protein